MEMRNQLIGLTLGIIALFATAAIAADFSLDWCTIDNGGQMFTTGGDFELSGTIGQPDAGVVTAGGDFTLTGGFWIGVISGPEVCRGDANCDGQIDFFDINGFVDALVKGIYCDETGDNSDINGDGTPDFYDINPLVKLLTDNTLPLPCP
jgi:hypothetical protein